MVFGWIFGVLWLALGYLLAALLCFVLIVTDSVSDSPRCASRPYALWPFGREHLEKPGPRPGALIGNVIWVILFGIWAGLGHVVSAVAMAVNDHRHPAGAANLKLIPVSLMLAWGMTIVPVDSCALRLVSSREALRVGVFYENRHRSGRASLGPASRHRPLRLSSTPSALIATTCLVSL